MKRILIIEDDKNIQELLRQELNDEGYAITIAGNGKEALSVLKNKDREKPDLIILDTKLTDGNGFELLKHFESCFFKIIFISTHIEYALKAIKFNAVDFLLKPPDPDELIQALNKAYDLISHEEKLQSNILAENIRNLNKKEKIILKTFDHIHIVNQDEIIRVEADRNYSTFYIVDGRKIVVSRSIKDFEDQLNEKGFYRIHKSHIINIGMVKYFDKAEGGYVVMNDGVSIPVASRKRELLLELFNTLA